MRLEKKKLLVIVSPQSTDQTISDLWSFERRFHTEKLFSCSMFVQFSCEIQGVTNGSHQRENLVNFTFSSLIKEKMQVRLLELWMVLTVSIPCQSIRCNFGFFDSVQVFLRLKMHLAQKESKLTGMLAVVVSLKIQRLTINIFKPCLWSWILKEACRLDKSNSFHLRNLGQTEWNLLFLND